MTSFSLNFFSNQIQCSHVFLIIQFPEPSNLKESYLIADETRDFPCIPVLPENFQCAPPVFSSALLQLMAPVWICHWQSDHLCEVIQSVQSVLFGAVFLARGPTDPILDKDNTNEVGTILRRAFLFIHSLPLIPAI